MILMQHCITGKFGQGPGLAHSWVADLAMLKLILLLFLTVFFYIARTLRFKKEKKQEH